MAPPHPTTVAGLLAQLEETADGLPAYLKALDQLHRQFRPPVPPLSPAALQLRKQKALARGIRPRDAVQLSRAELAVELIRQLRAVVRQVPTIVTACRAILADEAPPVASPLYVPDATDRRVIRDAGTAAAIGLSDAPIVPWWPRLPDAAVEAGVTTLQAVQRDSLIVTQCCEHHAGWVEWNGGGGPVGQLASYAAALVQVRGRAAGYDATARSIRGGNNPGRRGHRQTIRATANQYRELAAWLLPIADQLAAQLATYVSTLTASLSTLADSEGYEMPGLTSTPATISALSSRIREAITEGHGGRLVVSNAETAFSWAPGPAVTLLSYLATGTVTGRRTTVVTARDAATVVGPVAEGGTKPMVVDFSSAEVDLKKYAGQATITVESAQFVTNIETAVATVIQGQVVRAIEADAAGVMAAAAGVTITAAADITAGVLAAIAELRGNGASPNVVGLAAADWIEVMQATGAGGYLNFSNPETGPAGTWLGLAPVIVPGLSAGEALVADGRSVLVQEPAGGPLCLVDPFTQANVNKIVITIEAWAVPSVSSPGGVASVTVTTTP